MGLLSETQIRAAKPGPKEYLLNDGDNLYLRVRATGKAWIFYRYMRHGKPVKLGMGPYPGVTLAQARIKANEANSLRANGQDPKNVRDREEELARTARLQTFELMARAWHKSATKDRHWSDAYSHRIIRHLELHVFPWVGDKPIDTILPTEIVSRLHRPKERGNLETAQRIREVIQHIYQYAVDLGTLEPTKNFVNRYTGGLPSPRGRHYAAITDPAQLGQLMREWQKRDSRTPAHIVPLPRQALEILRELHSLTGPTGPVFRSMSRRSETSRYISENTINVALRTMGYDTKEQITGHGFRATARTMIREHLGWDPDVIERHLAHTSDEELGSSYDRAEFIAQRKNMVQQWADFLDELEAGKLPQPDGKVLQFIREKPRSAFRLRA